MNLQSLQDEILINYNCERSNIRLGCEHGGCCLWLACTTPRVPSSHHVNWADGALLHCQHPGGEGRRIKDIVSCIVHSRAAWLTRDPASKAEVESRISNFLIRRVSGKEKKKKAQPKYNFSYVKGISSRDLLYNMVTIASHSVLLKNTKRMDVNCPHHQDVCMFSICQLSRFGDFTI